MKTTRRYHLIPVVPTVITKAKGADEEVEKENYGTQFIGMLTVTIILKNIEVPQNTKHRITV